jgi:hypothetical protein
MPLILIALVFALLVPHGAAAQATAPSFGGAYAGLDARRQALIDDWVTRFIKTTGQPMATGPFYDEVLMVSTKTTFDAVTHALMTTKLTREDGSSLGDGLMLVERVEAVRGEVPGARGDHQFRMYVRLTPEAVDQLEQSREFKRGVDNTIYHKGYPINYRAQGGTPSIQVSIAPDRRRADVDVDYRASSFPAALFNGHLTSSNSDVRAGDNSDRHSARWAGLESWWRGFFGIRLGRAPADSKPSAMAIPRVPRAGKKNIDVMVNDFLTAWLIEGDAIAAMGYVSGRAYACLSQNADNPATFDLGMAPFQLLNSLKAAHDSLGPAKTLEEITVGVRPPLAGLKVVTQPFHSRVVITSVPDDVAAGFDCESRLTPGDDRKAARAYGNYFAATFLVKGHEDQRVSLLWGRDNGYWKIVSWRTGGGEDAAAPTAIEVTPAARIAENPALAIAARTFLDQWLIRRDFDAAFATFAAKSYGCYNLERGPAQPAAASPAEGGERIRAGLASISKTVGQPRNLAAALVAVEPFHPAVRVMNHRDAAAFTLTSAPNQLGDLAECDARARGDKVPATMAADYGDAFGMNVRFRTLGGDAPVLRFLWRNVDGAWKITSYMIETP